MKLAEPTVVTLASPSDAYSFSGGMPLVMTDAGDVRPATCSERLRGAIATWWLRWTRWLRPRTAVAAVDVKAGCVTLATERWSWRRWRWERS